MYDHIIGEHERRVLIRLDIDQVLFRLVSSPTVETSLSVFRRFYAHEVSERERALTI